MIHIVKGSNFDGFAEKMAERIKSELTDHTRYTILKLKNETPDSENIKGIEYYVAVIRDGITDYAEFTDWRKKHPLDGVVTWIP